MKTLYEVLGVSPTATDREIKSAFRQLALRFHSDTAGDSGLEVFRAAEEAYTILKDQTKRAQYDALVGVPAGVHELLLRHPVGDAVLAVLPHAPAQRRRGTDLVRTVRGDDPRPVEHLHWVQLVSQGARGQNSGESGDLFLYIGSDERTSSTKG